MLDTVLAYFLGELPDPVIAPVAYNLYYIAKLVIGILFLVLILDLMKIARRMFL